MSKRKLIEEKKDIVLIGNSLVFFKPDNCLRKFLKNVVCHNLFEMTIFAAVIASAVCITLEQPLSDPNSLINQVLESINLVITIIFTMELVMKIIVYGLIINGPDSYLCDGWNILDSFIVTVSIISIIIQEMSKKNS